MGWRHSAVAAALWAATALPAAAAESAIVASPAAPAFSAELYSVSAPRYVTVKNAGNAPVELGPVSFAGTDAGAFAVLADACSNRTINPRKACKLRLQFNAMQPMHASATAALGINDPDGNPLASVALSGTVTKGGVTATLSGLTVTLSNDTPYQYSLAWNIDGPFADTGNGTCSSILVFKHPANRKYVCTIVLAQSAAGPGQISIDVGTDFGDGRYYSFDIPLN